MVARMSSDHLLFTAETTDISTIDGQLRGLQSALRELEVLLGTLTDAYVTLGAA